MFLLGVFRQAQLYEFDLFKLMLADKPARVFSVTAGLASKTRRVCRIIFGQFTGIKDLLGVIIRDRDLCRRDQSKTAVVLYMKQVVLKFWQLICAKKGRPVYEKWRKR